ncbi:DUF2783 domain-containing protein [Sphaerotilus microaerophilus]|jgi:hypothetical protein|uniref:DUF2783 domain-containing protein n=1 Tax=Sphaerotilus microaerophilus TaxID=2914710 RepID=A0ABN6PKV1_9BURK|nr:DUF2783 domain-containing protein [Sphaerotilus sp. FB-5]BDI04657.1 hypothetical protein CATMQ487_16270 [Sphaerotilus sp. FB-5]
MNPTPAPTLAIDALETVYDQLAQAIDQAAASGRTELFLTKLALLNANALGSAERFQQQLEAALRDL